MKRYGNLLLVLIFVFLLLSPVSGSASWMKLTPDRLDQSAEIIVVGYIEGATGKYHYADNIWDTEWKVNVRYYLKGNRPDKNLTVYTPGVKDDNIFRSNDYSLNERGNLVLLFLAKRDNRYFPLTPQGIIGLQSNRYTKGVLDPPTGGTVLKEYSIKNEMLSQKEKEQMEEIIKGKTIFDPNQTVNQPSQEEKDSNAKSDNVRNLIFYVVPMLLILSVAILIIFRKYRGGDKT